MSRIFKRGKVWYTSVTAKGHEHTKNYRNRENPMTEQLFDTLKNDKRKERWVF